MTQYVESANQLLGQTPLASDLPVGALGMPWLPILPDWHEKLEVFEKSISTAHERWMMLRELASSRLGNLRTVRLDRAYTNFKGLTEVTDLTGVPLRLAILGSGTVSHLVPAIRVAALRRGMQTEAYISEYGQYFRDLGGRELNQFQPHAVLLAFDAEHLLGRDQSAIRNEADAENLVFAAVERLKELWQATQRLYGCVVIQQTLLPTFPSLMGHNESRLAWSLKTLIDRLNDTIRRAADAAGVELLAMDSRVREDGLLAWHNSRSWHHARQEIRPSAAPFYGDLVARLLAASFGRSKKCLVLDLDNTLWGGVIGDDGLEGIAIGQGDALGEAYSSFQHYVKELSRRGVILAVCSKNDAENAAQPFTDHPGMVLKRSDISCFRANWQDKATNIREIAEELNIGIDSIVFVDDNPVEREYVRQALPNTAVPEIGDDPSEYIRIISDAGYFESVSVTEEDLHRTEQYVSNHNRNTLRKNILDINEYLRDLDMSLHWSRIDETGVKRAVQLLNKTNQFNLTTKRYSESELLSIIKSDEFLPIQFRLQDRFGDNGVISIVILRLMRHHQAEIDTWLMSCRVLGRDVEIAVLNTIVSILRDRGTRTVFGDYRPTDKNKLVEDHYSRLGFHESDGVNTYQLDIVNAAPFEVNIAVSGK